MANILIPTDFSDNAWNAVEYAVNFFKKSTCNFYVLHVCHGPNTKASFNEHETCKKQIELLINRIYKQLPNNKKHKFFSVIDAGYLVSSVRKQVEQNQIDFIVMGTRGNSGAKNTPIGSNASNVITKVRCATIVVPENAKYAQLTEIAFPTDFLSVYSPKTLEAITAIIESNKASARVLHIKNDTTVLNEDQKRNKELLDAYLGTNEHSFHFLSNNHIENQVQDFVEKRQINLITMLAKNLSYFEKILFHPKMPKIKYYTDIPFLVLH
ncbi:universal stress protein [Seonamhaeicola algicola]|uniref:Universal stress protein n=1 Tax=Seonamhaeicola algicola TaxID=1719036 RepID=A0A5C7AMP2_9FLAO|nr:universal stress protein [Seonamhaeicola algicola]TXE10020.1 universal stress protein [Seonamhaeicola algicola]